MISKSLLRSIALLTSLGLGLAVSAPAQATTYQPNDKQMPPSGLLVPRDSANGEVQVYTYFKNNDPTVDWLADSSTAPDTFSPLCSFTAEFVLRQTGSNLGVGWYNVVSNATVAPTAAQIYTIFAPGAKVGDKVTGANIKSDPRYLGGLIGFALIGGVGPSYPHFTERKWNTICTDTNACSKPGPWISSVSYISKNTPNAFYVAFEDGPFTANSFGNDGDYNDYMFKFSGLTCQGGGLPCTVPGVQGICASGVSQCVVGGGTSCKQVLNPEAVEKCDGLDNDCNGTVDEGASCGAGLICDRGRCVGSCSAEFPCAGGLSCVSGRCVDSACATVSCNAGQVCRLGSCTDPCTGVICPGSQICRVGRCVDACTGVSCPSGQVCQGGACVPGCDCYPCGDPQKGCSPSSNLCVALACVNITCGPGDACVGGVCTDPCQGAVCPDGQTCTMGSCVDVQPPAGTAGGTTPNPVVDGGAVATGCGCRLQPSSDRPGQVALAAALFALALLRRRRATRT